MQTVIDLNFDDIRSDNNQPRKMFDAEHLAAIEDTWRERGQITPARVRKDTSGGPTPYVLVDGECRWRVGKKLHEADPKNPLFATFRAFVDETSADDLLIVQFVANSGKGHTPSEKADVMQRMADAGMPRNKIRARLGVPPSQFRHLKEFLDAPPWLRRYGSPTSIMVPMTRDDGTLVVDDSGRSQKEEKVVGALPLTHLAALSRYANQLVEWDRSQQAEHPHGEHRNVAETTICRVADKALRDGLSVNRLTRACVAVCTTIMKHEDVKIAPPRLPFVRGADGALRIPTTDPTELSNEALDALMAELETVLSRLRARQVAPVAAGSKGDVIPW